MAKPDGIIERALARLDPEQQQILAEKAAEEALRLEVQKRETELEYTTGKKTIEDHIDAFDMLEKQGRFTRQSMTSDVKTGAGKMRIESKSGATCFVATAAFEDREHATVRYLRWMRDRRLRKTAPGRAFIQWYWQSGPQLARLVSASQMLRRFVRAVLSSVVWMLKRSGL